MKLVSVWRYPVKSMQGEALETADVDELGIAGDRQWAIVDTATGLALTARRVPELLFATPRMLAAEFVEIELPDGTVTAGDRALSDWLDRPVRLTRAAAGTAGRDEIAADFEDEAGSEWFHWDGPDGTFHDSGRAFGHLVGEERDLLVGLHALGSVDLEQPALRLGVEGLTRTRSTSPGRRPGWPLRRSPRTSRRGASVAGPSARSRRPARR